MRRIGSILLLVFIFHVSFYVSLAQRAPLKIGDAAPELSIQEWIRGPPVKRFEPGVFYLIEFSGVGCAPCRLEIPHLSSIAKKYQERLKVISVYTLESNRDNIKDLQYVDRIKKLVASQDSKISYLVAADVPQQYTFDNWSRSAGMNGIPSGFLVDGSGRIVWRGYTQSVDDILVAAFSNNDSKSIEDATRKQTEEFLAIDIVVGSLAMLKKAGKFEKAVEKMDSLIAIYPYSTFFTQIKFTLLSGEDDERAYKYLQHILDTYGDNDYDWFHFIDETYSLAKAPRYDLAHEVADRAIRQASTNLIKAYAMISKMRIYVEQDDLQSAIDCCTRALETAQKETSNPELLKLFTENLEYVKEQRLKSRG